MELILWELEGQNEREKEERRGKGKTKEEWKEKRRELNETREKGENGKKMKGKWDKVEGETGRKANIKNQLFIPASKFKDDLTEINPYLENNNLDFFNLTDNKSVSNRNVYILLSKQCLCYSNGQALIKQTNQITCKTCDELFIFLFEEYIANNTCEAMELEQTRDWNQLLLLESI
ncbi:hypothetical protein RhiirC2_795538 [Rhizophagus irregularis]|uniref:Uncharacterized protein n=1 Tax=Rhizophagus irregularis TaxID=588596 RepID=A0A2N1MBD9_9GLOM|nr:hypothetical protein RhiirC2_795538 [Rhizophagus irregularis]